MPTSQDKLTDDLKSLRRIFMVWWPLAASWLIMGAEIPAISAVIARLPNASVNLAAFGGVVYPLALVIETPIIMLLSASTALCKDWDSYARLRNFMMWAGGILTGLHMLIVFTPLYYFVVGRLIQVPVEVVEPARIGLGIMLPWTWSIAYRRFNQGVMIRFGHSDAVGVGTVIRLITDAVVLGIGLYSGVFAGIVVGAAAQALGVFSEAIYVSFRIRPVLEHNLKPAAPQPYLTWKDFSIFYIPLVMTSFLNLVWNPIGSAALSRMNLPLQSLATWPVVSGLLFLIRSPGISFNEVVVAMLDRPDMERALRRFALLMGGLVTVIFLLFSATGAARWWFHSVSALPDQIAELARVSFWFGLPLPFLSVLQSWLQGQLMHKRKTRGISESLAVFLLTVSILLGVGVVTQAFPGVYVAMVAYTFANIAQTSLLAIRSRQS